MYISKNTIIKNDLVLVGGGHAHLILLMKFAKKPILGTRITLVSNELDTPYSGMIPGYIEGEYSWRESHIDLYKFAERLNIRFIHSEVINVSGKDKKIYFKDRPPLSFDFLSINCGIQSNYKSIKGADKYSLPVKPISKLAISFLDQIDKINSVAFIGGGAGSVELALALKKRYRIKNPNLKIIIVTGQNGLLKSFSKKTKNYTKIELDKHDIQIINNRYVIEIKKNKFITDDNKVFEVDKCVLSTNAMGALWLKKTDIKLNDDSFIIVNNCFQTNFEFIFAAGDIVEFNRMKLEKAGVFAVRSGKPLAKSIESFILNKKSKPYKHKKNYLALIGLSNGYAIATKFGLSNLSQLNYFLKKYIDRKFVNKFNNFENKSNYLNFEKLFKLFNDLIKINFFKQTEHIQMQCKGCAAKVPFDALKQSLPEDITLSSHDAAPVPHHPKLFQTIDMINAIISDPYLLGKIAANHSLSDIIAAKSRAISAQMILQLPLCDTEIHSRDIEQVLSGAKEILDHNECLLNGGHTMIGNDNNPVIGFSIIGEDTSKNKKNNPLKAKNEDLVILTGKIGSGLIFAGINNNLIDSHYQIDVVNQMSEGNSKFGAIINQLEILLMTDITGFGLANHLLNLIQRNKGEIGLTINTKKIKLYKGVTNALKKGVKSSLYNSNFESAAKYIVYHKSKELIDEVIYDPQTVGGLAFIISKNNKEKTFEILKSNSIDFSVIGFVNNIKNQIEIV